MTDIICVNPGARARVYQSLSNEFQALEPPFWTAMHAAYLREQGFSVAIIDAELEGWSPKQAAEEIKRKHPSVISISVMGNNPSTSSTPKMTDVRLLLQELRLLAGDIEIVLSGIHPSSLPTKTIKEEPCTYVATGEGLATLEGIMFDKSPEDIPGLVWLDNGTVHINPQPKLYEINNLPMPAWDLLPMSRYRCHNWHANYTNSRSPYGILWSSLGCPYNCTFCNIKAPYNASPGIRYRNPERVLDELQHLVEKYGVHNIKFLDELFAINKKQVDEICTGIVERGLDINAWAYARVDTVSREMLEKMKKAGINWIAFGIESTSENVRKGVNKGYTDDKILKAVGVARDVGLNIVCNLICGLPDDTLETMRADLEFAKRYSFESVNIYCATAYPGSDLYVQAVHEGWQLPENWSGYGQYAYDFTPLPTKHLTANQVLAFRDKAFTEYYTDPAFLSRIRQLFGDKAAEQILKMCEIKLARRPTEENNENTN